ncbi:hypothetical protein LVJ94_41485 [Pendulispora rubella]|uniref:Secreted protein n=1 Tax=Pendulispora rubella TaxID=2741070 RepID=A0ABZ2KXS2_9BACT
MTVVKRVWRPVSVLAVACVAVLATAASSAQSASDPFGDPTPCNWRGDFASESACQTKGRALSAADYICIPVSGTSYYALGVSSAAHGCHDVQGPAFALAWELNGSCEAGAPFPCYSVDGPRRWVTFVNPRKIPIKVRSMARSHGHDVEGHAGDATVVTLRAGEKVRWSFEHWDDAATVTIREVP